MQRRKLTPVHSAHPASSGALSQMELVEISQLGAVLRVRRNFEPGTALALGVHLCEGGGSPAPRFLDLEGTVVDCRPVDSPSTEATWQVTLLFDSLTDAQRLALGEASSATPQPSPFSFPPQSPCGFSIGPWGEFPVDFGLN